VIGAGGIVVDLPFTKDQFLNTFAAYNSALWPFVIALWGAAAIAVGIRRTSPQSGRIISAMLAMQWAWSAYYHGAFFASINPAARLFEALFVVQAALLAWVGIIANQLHFSTRRSARFVIGWMLIAYALAYPFITHFSAHRFPWNPTFGVPCPTAILTIGLLLQAEEPWPRLVAVIPILWALFAGSAAVLLGVTADLMLWAAATALIWRLVASRRRPAVLTLPAPRGAS
jgi:hypothetical protein